MKFIYQTNSKSYYSERYQNEVVIEADSKAEADHKIKNNHEFGRDPKWTLSDVRAN